MLDFDTFFADSYGRVVRTLVLAGIDAGSAEDAAQEAFARALARWRRVRETSNPAGWVYVVALRQAWRRHRDAAVDRPHAAAPPDTGRALDVRAALTQLPSRQRQAVVLRYYADLSVAEIAEAMACAEGTVKSTLHAAIASLRTATELEGALDD